MEASDTPFPTTPGDPGLTGSDPRKEHRTMRAQPNRPGRWRAGVIAAVLAPALTLGAPMAASAQEVIVLTGRAYPVAIHAGTCNELIAEPSYDLGLAQPRPMIAAADDIDDDGILTTGDFYADGDDRPIDENTVLLTGEDLDGDGIADFGFDLNENDLLDAEEVFERPIVWSFLGDLADLTPVGVDDDDDVELQDLREVPHAIVIHQAAVTDLNYLSCGEIEGVSINDEVVVPLLPVTENGLTGVAIMEAGEDGFLGIGGDAGLTNIHAWPRLTPLAPPPTPTPAPPTPTPLPPTPTPVPPTPTPVPPTPTPEPTPTPVVIEVPTEVTVEFRDEGIVPADFTILANTDTEFTLANLTLEPKTFFIDGLDLSQEVPAGETVAIVVNAPIGEYGYGVVEDEAQRGTLRVIERAE